MISNLILIAERGIQEMRTNSQFMLIGVLVFIFPLFFVYVTQSFFETAYTNIETSEKRRVALLHDNISFLLSDNNSQTAIQSLIDKVTQNNADLTKIRVVSKDKDGFKIVYANDESLINTYEIFDELYRTLPLSTNNQSFIVSLNFDGTRVWQVFRSVEIGDQLMIIFSEHSFAIVDSVMSSRRQQSYYGLTAIFVFLIALAYWLKKQVLWEKRSNLLAEQIKERDLFSNMIAHEFRTPLTVIKGYASFLQDSKSLTDEEKRYTDNIRTSAERLVVLVNDFLEVSRIQANKIKIELVETDIREVIKKVCTDLQTIASEKKINLSYEVEDEPVMLKTDVGRIEQVLVNLITNAIKYTEKGEVKIQLTDTREGVTIKIMDTGMGISADDQKKLFSPFARVGGVEKTNITGTGLGMWITKQLVELLGGQIGIESIKGQGTHVVINFKDL